MPEGVAFEVDHFEWIDDRLEVSGRWYGLRGHRFVRPSLTVEVDEDGDDRRRMLADLEHKPWAADDGTDWIAAFPWDGEPVELARAELAVAPTLAVDLPIPPLPSRRRTAPKPTTKSAHRPPPPPPRERDAATTDQAALTRERDSLGRERDEAVADQAALTREIASLTRERDEAVAARAALTREIASLTRERDKATGERAALSAERDAADAERDTLARERDGAVRARAAAVAERDDARRSLAAAIEERDRSEEARAALLREHDAARAARQRDLEALEEPGDRRLAPAAPRPLPRQSALALWGQRFVAVVGLGVLAFVVYTLLEGVV
ncbi:MAG: hypothetical protein V7607_966 [Solirubrobacteraceae bacterium]